MAPATSSEQKCHFDGHNPNNIGLQSAKLAISAMLSLGETCSRLIDRVALHFLDNLKPFGQRLLTISEVVVKS